MHQSLYIKYIFNIILINDYINNNILYTFSYNHIYVNALSV